MPKIKQFTPISLFSFSIPVLLLAAALFGGTVFASYRVAMNDGTGEVLSGRPEDAGPPAHAKASDKARRVEVDPLVSAQVHKNNVKKVVSTLTEIAEVEKEEGDEEVANEIEEVLVGVNGQQSEETARAMIRVESRPKWQTALMGADYKNLGQLRSQIVRNQNTISQLARTMDKTENPDSALALAEQAATLQLEQTRLWTIVAENEGAFSILGWVFRFLNNYTNLEPVEELVNGIGGTDLDENGLDTENGETELDETENGDEEENGGETEINETEE
jgi:hypothetical protein